MVALCWPRESGVQNNAVGAFELLNTLLDVDSLGLNPVPVKMFVNPANPLGGIVDVSHPLAHTQDTPAWWNMGSRPRKFFDAGVNEIGGFGFAPL